MYVSIYVHNLIHAREKYTKKRVHWGWDRKKRLGACQEKEADLHPSGLRPNATIAESPNAFDDIQVGERMNTVILTPSTGCRLGTICIELEPFPMTPTRLFRKSYLDLVSPHCPTSRMHAPRGHMYMYYIYNTSAWWVSICVCG